MLHTHDWIAAHLHASHRQTSRPETPAYIWIMEKKMEPTAIIEVILGVYRNNGRKWELLVL